MYERILRNNNLPVKERLKRMLAYSYQRRNARIGWNKHFKKVFEVHPTYETPAEKSVERAHKLYWKPFNSRINIATLRVCKNISGISNPKFIPEEIYVADIEPTLNQTPSVEYLANKSLYNHWFPGEIFPGDHFHNVDGEWLDENLNPVSFNEVKSIARHLDYPVVLKPNMESYGGKDVFFPTNYEELIKLASNRKNFLVQEEIKQHTFFEQFNRCGVNSLRVNVYRSVKDNRLHVVNIALRMGVGGSLDNVSAGGVATMIQKDGFLNGFAVDKCGTKFFNHPDTGVGFNKKIPDFEELKETSLKIAAKILYARLVALDLYYDPEGNWRMIEINILGNTIRAAQYFGALFFGEFTDEIHDFCLRDHWTLDTAN